MARDPRIDAYIDKAGDFAQPVLRHFRDLVHRTIPDAEESLKWGMPHFTHKSKNVAGMAAFKAHCAVIVHGAGRQSEPDGMGSYGKVTSLDDLPGDVDRLVRRRLRGIRARRSRRQTVAQGAAGLWRSRRLPAAAVRPSARGEGQGGGYGAGEGEGTFH